MSIETNASITIERTNNGFLVRKPTDFSRAEPSCIGDMKVFQSHAELAGFIAQHFNFRCKSIVSD